MKISREREWRETAAGFVMRAGRLSEPKLVVAAQAGDRRALDELVAAYLPLVYANVRRTLGGPADVDDVVQETMLRALRHLRTLRTPASFRCWLTTIATRQVGTHLRRRQAELRRTASLDEAIDLPDVAAEDLALVHVELSGHRRQVVRASRWLDLDDRALLPLWWLQIAGRLTRNELAAALGTTVPHAGVRVQRMRHRLELSRSLVAALQARPRCAQLTSALGNWDGVPSPLWRKRVTRHTRSCPVCARATGDMVPLERLVLGLALLPAPVTLSPGVLLDTSCSRSVRPAAPRPRPRPQGAAGEAVQRRRPGLVAGRGDHRATGCGVVLVQQLHVVGCRAHRLEATPGLGRALMFRPDECGVNTEDQKRTPIWSVPGVPAPSAPS